MSENNDIELVEDEFKLDDYEENENDSSSDQKLERYQINSFTIDRSVETLIKWYKNGKLIIPEFQRDYVWTFANSSRFIESILLSLPVPPIFLFRVQENDDEKFMLIDGMQRVTTLNQFKEGTWIQNGKKKKFKLSTSNENWNKKTFENLSTTDREFFNDYPVMTTIFESRNKEHLQEKNAIFSVFERINTGSEKLSDQEIRNAIYSGKLLGELKNISDTPSFKSLVEKDLSLVKREKMSEIALRFCAYYFVFKRYKNDSKFMVNENEDSQITSSKKITLNNYMALCNDKLIDFEEDLKLVLKACETISSFDPFAFYSINKKNAISNKVHELFAEALIIATIENCFEINISKQDFLELKINLWNDEKLINPFKYKTTSKESVLKRVELVLKWIKG